MHIYMSSGFRVLENQDRELGIGDVGSLFGGRVFRLIAKFAALFIGGKMMPSISMSMLHETCSTLPDLKSS